MKTIQNLGFSCRIETINAVEAWRGSLPGDGYSNVRRIMLHTLNLADMLPITSVWAGLRENPSAADAEAQPAAAVRRDERSHAVPRESACVRSRPHADVGPSGAGKSTAFGLIAAQWFRYPRAQVFAFDQGLFDLDADRSGRRRVLRPGRSKDRSRLLPAEGNRFRGGPDVGSDVD